ncbi:MAG: acyl-CoA dehydrogenase family protein [Mycobacteriaceae bacterium]
MSPRSTLDQLINIDSLLTPEELAIQSTAQKFASTELRPHIAEWFDTGEIPVKQLAIKLGSLGLLGMHLSGYGCAGLNAVSYGIACMEMEAVDSGIRSLVSVQGSLAMYAIAHYGSPEQKQQWLPSMAAGESVGCFGLTESECGSNPARMSTRAVADGDQWVINGSKMWITNGSVADIAIIWAHTSEGIRGFVVPTDTPGFSAQAIPKKLSLRASVTAELFFQDLRLPKDAILPKAQGLAGPLGCLNEARFGIIFGALGAARDCLESTLCYTQSRVVFDKTLSSYQLTQAKIADMAIELSKGQLLAIHLGRLKEAGLLRPEQISIGKLNNTREAIAIARQCRTLMGANGITLDYPVLRHANNLESVLTYEGTAEVHQLVIGQALTGVSALR